MAIHIIRLSKVLKGLGLVYAQFWSKSDNSSSDWKTTAQIIWVKYWRKSIPRLSRPQELQPGREEHSRFKQNSFCYTEIPFAIQLTALNAQAPNSRTLGNIRRMPGSVQKNDDCKHSPPYYTWKSLPQNQIDWASVTEGSIEKCNQDVKFIHWRFVARTSMENIHRNTLTRLSWEADPVLCVWRDSAPGETLFHFI